jgi:hypothetical protein
MMGREEYEQRQKKLAEHAASEGATYYDPDSPVIWKRYIIGPVGRWRRTLWWFFPPSHAKMRRIMKQRSDKLWQDATAYLTGSRRSAGKDVARVGSQSFALLVVSLVGPVYYGYTHGPYWRVIVWASACTVIFCWQERSTFKHTVSTAPPSILGRFLLVLAIIVLIAVGFIAVDTLVYLFAWALH